jgi:hypothetical protein
MSLVIHPDLSSEYIEGGYILRLGTENPVTMQPWASPEEVRSFVSSVKSDPRYWTRIPTPEEQAEVARKVFLAKKEALTEAVQKRLDEFAQSRNYHNALSCATYATSQNAKFKTEGQYMVEARDAMWAKCYEILDEVEQGLRPEPGSFEDIESELPALSWPEV